MFKNGIELRAIANNPYEGPGLKLYAFDRVPSGKHGVAKPIEFDYVEDGLIRSSMPILSLDVDAAQSLMNELWDCGLRPAGAAGSMGQLEAVKYHLEDLRKLVFKCK